MFIQQLRTGIKVFTGFIFVLFISIHLAASVEIENRDSDQWYYEIQGGICVVLGLNQAADITEISGTESKYKMLVYFQSADPNEVIFVRGLSEKSGLLGKRIFVEKGSYDRIHLADNIADVVEVHNSAKGKTPVEELLRILHPGGKLIVDGITTIKPVPPGFDNWTHPSHLPDNNLVSGDQAAKEPYITQYISFPYFGSTPQVAVASGGRIFRAYGNYAPIYGSSLMLNTLVAMNSYNGTILWKKCGISNQFVANRYTMVADDNLLYMADGKVCYLWDAATGVERDRIIADTEEKAWKWMSIQNGTLYGLLAKEKDNVQNVRFNQAESWKYGGSATAGLYFETFGMGNLLVAINLAAKTLRWKKLLPVAINSRGICMDSSSLFYHSQQDGCIAALKLSDGALIWENRDEKLHKELIAVRKCFPFFQESSYLVAGNGNLYINARYFVNTVALSGKDGHLLWSGKNAGRPHLLVLNDKVFVSSVFTNTGSMLLNPSDGSKIRTYLFQGSACTKMTANQENIYAWFNQGPGTGYLNFETGVVNGYQPMRPGCSEGVVTANGMLHWDPWHCACSLFLYGSAGLAHKSQGKLEPFEKRMEFISTPDAASQSKKDRTKGWYNYRGNNQGTAFLPVNIAVTPEKKWEYKGINEPTASVAFDGMVVFADASGVITCLDEKTGSIRHKNYTSGKIFFPPTFWKNSYYAGSADGWMYCYDSKTGKMNWRFRLPPEERKILVYGRISSLWPVRSGVLVEDGVAYASSGLQNYDGHYVYALDADSGKEKWHDEVSGTNKISAMGQMLSYKGVLYLSSGGRLNPLSAFQMNDGKRIPINLETYQNYDSRKNSFITILNGDQKKKVMLLFGRDLYLLNDIVYPSGRLIDMPQNIIWSYFGGFSLSEKHLISREFPGANDPRQLGIYKLYLEKQRITCRNRNSAFLDGDTPLWETEIPKCSIEGIVSGINVALVIYSIDNTGGVAMFNVKDGKILWEEKFSSMPVPWGIALTESGNIIISLSDNRTICYGGKDIMH